LLLLSSRLVGAVIAFRIVTEFFLLVDGLPDRYILIFIFQVRQKVSMGLVSEKLRKSSFEGAVPLKFNSRKLTPRTLAGKPLLYDVWAKRTAN